MEASSTTPTPTPFQFQPDTEKIKQYLLNRGVYPIPKFVRNISKKQIQKYNRTLTKRPSQTQSSILTLPQKQALADETHFRNLKREYRRFTRAISPEAGSTYLVGRPWERVEKLRSREIASETREFNGGKLKKENLEELREMFEEDLRWVLDDDIEMLEGIDCYYSNATWDSVRLGQRQRSEEERIRFLVDRLSQLKVTARDWKLVRMMKQSELRFSEDQLLKILEGLGEKKKWQQALAVVERVYEKKREYRSRFVYTKLLAVLGKARRPHEALSIFNLMRGDCNIYPDMAAYHSIAVTLGQAGLLKELVDAIETMKQRPKRIRNMCLRNWDPVLEPDVVVFNAVLNACISSHQWKGVSWVFQQLRKSGLKPDGATYGLAMEVMLQSGKYDLVHEYFRKMTKKGEAPKAVTYKVLVRAFWEEGKVNEAVEAVREMEERGVVGTAGVYYELACCLCYSGRWQVAIKEVEKIKKLPHSRPLVVAYTGMIHSSMDGGYVDHCISIFEHMKHHCAPNIGTINVILKVYGRNDMFSEAKALFEEIKCASDGTNTLIPNECTYTQMLEASASASQWEYFDYVYREMALSGYQLGQSKHARLLVEASRAGKWHLLEHAFDTILEDGEIPNQLLFTKMVIQAVAQHNYEKAISLIGAMVHAPYQLSEMQWTDILEGSRSIICPDGFVKLLDALLDCDAQSEITVVNLSKSLQKLCASDTPMDLSSSPAYDAEDSDDSSLDFKNGCINDDDGRVYMLNTSLNVMGGKHDCGREGRTAQCANAKACVDDVASSESHKGSDGEPSVSIANGYGENDDIEIDSHITQFDDFQIFSLPSANQILDAWKESRKQDGVFPFRLCQK